MEIKDILDYVTGMPRNNNINVLKTMLETLIEEYSIGDTGSVGVEDIIEYVMLTPHNSNVNVLRTMLESLIGPEPVVEGEAYAVFDSADGSLVFFRDEPGKYSEGQVEDTKTYYTGVEGEGPFGWTDKRFMVTNVRFDDDIKPIKTESWFADCNSLISINMSNLDTSNVTDMSNMFNNCRALTSIDVSGFDTSNVVNMSNMFSSCDSLTSLNVSSFDTSKVTDMSYMFNNCVGLASLNLSNFNTSNVVNMEGMFYNCSGLESLNVTSFDTSNVTNMHDMFTLCNGLTSLDISNFDTSKVANMSSMFSNCYNLLSLNTSGFDMTEATNIEDMFWNCRNLTTDITLSKKSILSKNTFYQAATNPPAKIRLYGEGDVTSDDIDNFIAEVKTDSPDSNIVNGMKSDKVVFDEDVVLDNPDTSADYNYVPLTALADFDSGTIVNYIFSDYQMKWPEKYGDEWVNCRVGDGASGSKPINSIFVYFGLTASGSSIGTEVSIVGNPDRCAFYNTVPVHTQPLTRFHLYVEKKD